MVDKKTAQPEIKTAEDGIKFKIRVIPNASRCEISEVIDKEIKIKLDVPPVEGKANEKCVKFLAKSFGVSKSSVLIISGEKSRSKVLFVKGNPDQLQLKLVELLNYS